MWNCTRESRHLKNVIVTVMTEYLHIWGTCVTLGETGDFGWPQKEAWKYFLEFPGSSSQSLHSCRCHYKPTKSQINQNQNLK